MSENLCKKKLHDMDLPRAYISGQKSRGCRLCNNTRQRLRTEARQGELVSARKKDIRRLNKKIQAQTAIIAGLHSKLRELL